MLLSDMPNVTWGECVLVVPMTGIRLKESELETNIVDAWYVQCYGVGDSNDGVSGLWETNWEVGTLKGHLGHDTRWVRASRQ